MAYMVTCGAYDSYRILHVFADHDGDDGAVKWAERYNAAVPWSHEDDKARVEEIGFTPSGQTAPPVPVVIEGRAR